MSNGAIPLAASSIGAGFRSTSSTRIETVFWLDTRRAVTIKNRLAAHLSFASPDGDRNVIQRESDEAATFIATPPDSGWSDYQIIMWQGQTPAGYATLKKLGVTAGMVRDRPPR